MANNGGYLESKSGSVCTPFSYINNVLHEVEDPTYCISNRASSNNLVVTTTCTGQYIFEVSGSSYRIKTGDNSKCWGLNGNKVDLVAYPGSCNNFAVCKLFLPLYNFIFLIRAPISCLITNKFQCKVDLSGRFSAIIKTHLGNLCRLNR